MAFNKKITFQSYSESFDSIGNQSETWSDLRSVWSEVLPVSSREYFAAAESNSQNDITFRIRFASDIAAFSSNLSCIRIVFRQKFYSIKSIIDVNDRHLSLEIHAECVN